MSITSTTLSKAHTHTATTSIHQQTQSNNEAVPWEVKDIVSLSTTERGSEINLDKTLQTVMDKLPKEEFDFLKAIESDGLLQGNDLLKSIKDGTLGWFLPALTIGSEEKMNEFKTTWKNPIEEARGKGLTTNEEIAVYLAFIQAHQFAKKNIDEYYLIKNEYDNERRQYPIGTDDLPQPKIHLYADGLHSNFLPSAREIVEHILNNLIQSKVYQDGLIAELNEQFPNEELDLEKIKKAIILREIEVGKGPKLAFETVTFYESLGENFENLGGAFEPENTAKFFKFYQYDFNLGN